MPANATRQANLPNKDYDLVALVPWISANCTLSYLVSAASDPVRAILFYPPNNSTSEPPAVNDPMWLLNDGGAWKSNNHYPAYAIPGEVGNTLMFHLSHYSGNMTDVEYGHNLTENHDSRDYVRMYADISTGSHDTLPSLWVFLVIVLAVLVFIIAITSVAMHWIQKRHRRSLHRRVVNGEVDLEALGIKRMTVSKDMLDGMPLFVYVAEGAPADAKRSMLQISGDSAAQERSDDGATSPSPLERSSDESHPPTNHQDPLMNPPMTVISPPSPVVCPPTLEHASRRTSQSTEIPPPDDLPRHALPYSQATCPICLDDFVSGHSIVRELPCSHFFHPECVDDFFQTSSSLCPMCKKSVLPRGYCPNITNSTVRRERMIRRMRERVTVHDLGEGSRLARLPFVALVRGQFAHASSLPGRTPSAHVVVDSSPMQMTETVPGSPPPLAVRGEWGRRRAIAMLGRSASASASADIAAETQQEARLPRCKPCPAPSTRATR